jgi:hypothetical protein
MTTKSNILKNKMVKALVQTLGNVSQACIMLFPKDEVKQYNQRMNHYKWMKKDEDYKIAVKDIENISIDFAEHSLKEQIKAGNTTATIFYLKTKGKDRGYIETQHNVNENKEPLKIEVKTIDQANKLKDL